MRQRVSIAIRSILGGVLAAMAACAGAQQPYPSKPIRIVIAIVPGGSTNNLARFIGDKLRDDLGQPVIVENRPGANTVIGTESVARAVPDGYTLLFHTGTHTILPFVEANLPFDPIKDFTAVATTGRTPYMMLVHPSVPAKTLKEFIAHAKARPKQLRFASSGSSSGSRLAGEVFNMLAGVNLENIPYKGAGQVLPDLLAGRVEVSFNSPTVGVPLVNSGKLNGLAIAGDRRLAAISNVPTFTEAGMPAFNEQAWWGMLAPAGTLRPIVDKLSGELARMQSASDVKVLYEKQGIEPFVSTPDQYTAFLKAEIAKLAKLIKTANLRFDD